MPRQLQNGVEIGADNRSLLTAKGHLHQLAAFFHQRFGRLFFQLQLLDLVRIILCVCGRVVILAELLLYGALLLAQKVELLALVDAALCLDLDLTLELADIGFVHEHVENGVQPLKGVKDLENALLGLVVKIHGGRDVVRQLARVFAKRHLEDNVRRHFGRYFQIFFKLILD